MNPAQILAAFNSHFTVLTSLAVLAALGPVLLIANRLRKAGANRLTLIVANLLTIVAAALATTVSASGMWKFFTSILGESPLRIVFFAYIEVALFASALLARMRLLRDPDKGSTGVDGVAVWVLAGLTASLSAMDADSFREVCLRLVAPMVAAWMWERALAAERSARLGRTVSRVHWAITLERIFVWLRLAEAHGREVSDVDRARRRARLARARLRLHLLQTQKPLPARRLRRAYRRVIRLAMQSAEHTGLADFPHAADEREAMQMYMATLYGFVDATSPATVAQLNAWRTNPGLAVQPIALDAVPEDEPAVDNTDVSATATPTPAEPSAEPTWPSEDDPNHPQLVVHPAASVADAADDDSDGDEDEDAVVVGIHSRISQREHDRGQASDDDPEHVDESDEPSTDDDGDPSSVAAMRRFWENEVKHGRIPTGAELSRAAGVPPNTGLGRRKRREWQPEVSALLRRAELR